MEVKNDKYKTYVHLEKTDILLNNHPSLQQTIIDNKVPDRSKISNYYGIFFALLTAFCNSLANVLIKKANFFSGSDIATSRYIIQLTAMLVFGFFAKTNLLGKKEIRKTLLLIGIFNTCIVLLFFLSVKLISPSESSALYQLNMIMIPVFARCYLKEKFSIFNLFSLVLSVVGVLFISQPSFIFEHNIDNRLFQGKCHLNSTMCDVKNENIGMNKIMGITSGLLSALFGAIVSVLAKKIANKKVNFSLPVTFQAFVGIPASLLISLISFITGTKKYDMKQVENSTNLFLQILFAVGAGVFGVLLQVFWNLSLKYEETSKVSIICSTSLLFTFLFQYLILNITSSFLSTLGALLIFFSTLSIIFFQILEKKNSRERKNIINDNKTSDIWWKNILFLKI